MYTRCSECETLFRVSREQLNAARGQVRCGHCGMVFDALASLREEVALPGESPDTVFPKISDDVVADATPDEDEVPEHIPYEFLLDTIETPAPPRVRRWPWITLAVILVLGALLQTAHMQREVLADSELFGPYISMIYEAAGHPLQTAPLIDLQAFALLHHELVSHPRTSGALHLSGVLNNAADHAQPWPILELRLEDRFGDVVAARRLEPAEYLRNPPVGGELMPAHARRAIEISIVDPGADAVGFNIDFCVMLEDGLRCAAQN